MHDVAAYRLFFMPPRVCLALPARLRLAPRRPPYVLVPIIDQSSGSFTRSSSHRAEPTEPSTNAILQAKMMVLQMLALYLKSPQLHAMLQNLEIDSRVAIKILPVPSDKNMYNQVTAYDITARAY